MKKKILQRTMVRVVSEAAGRTCAEGELGHRPSRGLVYMRFVLISTLSNPYIEPYSSNPS